MLQEQPANPLGEREASLLHEDLGALGSLLGRGAFLVFPCDFGRAPLARLANLVGLQPTRLLVSALLGRDAQGFGEVVPRYAGRSAVLDCLQLAGVGTLAQELPQLRTQYRSLSDEVDRAILRLRQLARRPLRVLEHQEQLLRGGKPFELWVTAQAVQFTEPIRGARSVDRPQAT
ncbi:hypothetical protein [Streptomyces sp. NPDC020681]|uniref:hypothetical protein n=1 Tax=Streptomyces sp. NPDC020681 TaxID=3365083 RepID=UPI00379886D9